MYGCRHGNCAARHEVMLDDLAHAFVDCIVSQSGMPDPLLHFSSVQFVLSSTLHSARDGIITKEEFLYWSQRFGPTVEARTFYKVSVYIVLYTSLLHPLFVCLLLTFLLFSSLGDGCSAAAVLPW